VRSGKSDTMNVIFFISDSVEEHFSSSTGCVTLNRRTGVNDIDRMLNGEAVVYFRVPYPPFFWRD
jgi:hypothetical protein